MANYSKTQIDKLGERLKAERIAPDDLKMLDEYRGSFRAAYDAVFRKIESLDLRPSGRPSKSTPSIVDKLKRESIRLSQMQDIAGWRIVVDTIAEQDEVAAKISAVFPKVSIVDRRKRPSHGYRAVHAIILVDDHAIEVQIRTKRQHQWAEYSEMWADALDPSIKYGSLRRLATVLEWLSDCLFAMPESNTFEVEWVLDNLDNPEFSPNANLSEKERQDRLFVYILFVLCSVPNGGSELRSAVIKSARAFRAEMRDTMDLTAEGNE